MDISKLAEEKVKLQLTLQGLSMANAYGHSFDDAVAAEKQRIETIKRFNEVSAMIDQYTNALAYQNALTQ